MNEKRFAEGFEQATWHVESPHVDLNFVGTFALSELIREKGFRVVLNGSDEIFAGYSFFLPDYLRGRDLTSDRLGISEYIRKKDHAEVDLLGAVSAARRQVNTIPTVAILPHKSWVAKSYGNADPHETSNFEVTGSAMAKIHDQWFPLHTAEYLWTKSLLPGLLLKLLGDRGEMAHSIEGRSHFLDHHLSAYVNGLPPSVQINHVPRGPGPEPIPGPASTRYRQKRVLREVARPFVPDEVYKRKKQEFEASFEASFEFPPGGPIHRMLKRLVTGANLEQYVGFVDPKPLVAMVDQAFGKGGVMNFRFVVQAAMVVV